MSRLAEHLAQTDQRIHELTARIDLCRDRVARRSEDPALAEQAEQSLPAMSAQLEELERYRMRLSYAVEVEASSSPQAEQSPRRGPLIPRYMR